MLERGVFLLLVLAVGCGSRGPLRTDVDDDEPGDAGPPGRIDSGPGVDGGTCFDPFLICDGECVDPEFDRDHCGGCFRACGDGEFCDRGECVMGEDCRPPLSRCGADCVDTAVDPSHCGGCDVACAADEVCGEGVCALECPSGTTLCGASCVDTETSSAHCGGCGRTCDGDEVCRMGGCIPVRDLTDTDGDGIADIDEGRFDAGGAPDTDGDGRPDFMDTDADGDGYLDAREAGDTDPGTTPVDSDRDGIADFRDDDSDGDGVPDRMEAMRGCLDPTEDDTDGDGQTDLAEITAGTDPCDPMSRIPEFYYILPTDDPGGESASTLTFDTNIRRADVHISFDTSGSMGEEIDNLQSALRTTVIPGIMRDIPDSAFGVSEFEDFPISPFGSPGDAPHRLLQQVTTDTTRVQTAINRLDMPLGSGGDLPESIFEALYQSAAGTGISWRGGSVPAFRSDPTTPGAGDIGGVGFRDDAFPIVILITDDQPHTPADYAAGGIAGTHGRDDVITAMNAIGAKLIGVSSGSATRMPRRELEAIAIATGAVIPPRMGSCPTGIAGASRAPSTLPDGTTTCPLVFDARSNGSGLATTLVDAVNELVTSIRFDTVSIRVVDDPNGFIRATIPRSAVPPPGGASPTVADLDGDSIFDSFVGVTPGTVVSFTVLAFNDVVPQTSVDQVFMVRLQVIGNGVTVLDEKPVIIIVPRLGS